MKSLQDNKKWVDANKQELLNLYPNKYILVVDQSVVGSYDTYDAAATAGVETYGIGGDFYIDFLTEEEPINFVLSAML